LNVAAGPDGSVFIQDGNTVRRVGPDGIITMYAGGGSGPDGGPAATAVLNIGQNSSIALGPDGSLYVAETFANAIRRVSPAGIISTVAGSGAGGFGGDGGPALNAMLNMPTGVAVFPDGSVLIADTGNSRVRLVSPKGGIRTIAGSGVSGFTNGYPGAAAKLNAPAYVAVGPDGVIYFSEQVNGVIRQIRPALPKSLLTDIVIASEDGSEVYVFNSNGRHQRTLDALTGGLRHQFTYGADGYLASVTDGDGNVTSIARAGSVVAAIVAPGGQRTTLGVNADGLMQSISNPANDTHFMKYSAGGLLQEFTDPSGNVHSFTYDGLGRLVRDQDPAGGSIGLARTEQPTGYTVTSTSALGRLRIYQVEQLPTGTVRRTVTAPSGTTTVRLVNPDGSEQTTYADGSTQNVVYGPDPRFGMLAPIPASVTLTTPGGLTRTITTARTATLSDPTNLLSLSNLTETVTDNGAVSTSVYDVTGGQRSITRTTAAGRSGSVLLDSLGRVTRAQAAGLDPVVFSYDSRGLLSTITEGSGVNSRTTSLVHDAAYRLTGVTDAINRTFGRSYDGAGRPVTETRPDGSVVGLAYDASGNLTGLTPPGRTAHRFGYSTIDQVANYTPPDLGSGTTATQYAYDTDRALTRTTRPDGLLVDFGYDNAGRLNSLLTASGGIGFSYDATSDRLTGVLAPSGIGLSYGYDGRLITAVAVSGPVAGSLARTYDNHFRRTAEAINGATSVTFAYDADGLLTAAGSLTLSRNAQNGLLTGSSLGLVADSLSYNTLGELVDYNASFGASPIYSATYLRDALGRITQRSETIGGVSAAYAYGYDLAGRLFSVSKDSVPFSAYSYDSNGNRTSKTGPGGPANASYDAQDRLVTYGSNTYAYTANGELQSKTSGALTTRYQYDALGNLLRVTLPGGTIIDYLIDGANRRVGKKVNGVLIQGFLYAGALRPIAELGGNGAVVSRFVYATHVNVPDYMVSGGATYRIVTDQLGSPRLVVDVSTGAVAQRIDYDEFGRVANDTSPGFQPFGFAGGLYDSDSGLVRFGARDYDAEVGRWTAKDPLRFGGGDSNLYGYVGSDPVNGIDPSGLQACGQESRGRDVPIWTWDDPWRISPHSPLNPDDYISFRIDEAAMGFWNALKKEVSNPPSLSEIPKLTGVEWDSGDGTVIGVSHDGSNLTVRFNDSSILLPFP
jgi:RHS repeat-associated protein